MRLYHRGATMRSCAFLMLSLATVARAGRAQEAAAVEGIVRTAAQGTAVADALVRMQLASGDALVASVRTDSLGRFSLTVHAAIASVPLLVITQRIGFLPDTLQVAGSNRRAIDIYLREVPLALDSLRISAQPTANHAALAEATRRGWRVYGPERVSEYRDRAGSMSMLMRLTGVTGVVPARYPNDCIRSIRNQHCLVFVVDGVVIGTTAYINPVDVEFFSLVNQAESRLYFGERAPYGAIVIRTRSAADANDLGPRRLRP